MNLRNISTAAVLGCVLATSALAAESSASARGAAFLEAMSRAGSHYEANQGQLPTDIPFCFRGPAYRLDLTGTALTLQLPGNEVMLGGPMRIRFAGAQAPRTMEGVDPLRFQVMHPVVEDGVRRGLAPVKTYGGVAATDIYNGVDVRFHSSKGRLEYDFIVAPGGSAESIELEVEGSHRMEVSAAGDLDIRFPVGRVIHHKPVIYQEVEGKRTYVDGSYVLQDENHIRFDLAPYDRNLPLIIDPVLTVQIDR